MASTRPKSPWPAREILDTIGIGQKYTNEIIGKVFTDRQQPGPARPGAGNTLEGLEEDIQDDTGVTVQLPLDVEGAESCW